MMPNSEHRNEAEKCPRCGGVLKRSKAIFGSGQLLKGAMFENEPKPPTLQDCLKCASCGYSETLAASSDASDLR
jgi:predicted nucleic-acid-binding Zn-ribbon protein